MSKIYEKKAENPKKKLDSITNAVLVILSIALVSNFAALLTDFLSAPVSYSKSEDSLWYDISRGQYAKLVAESWQSRFMKEEETEGMKQCGAVMDYYEAASLYKVAVEKGDMEGQKKYAAIMEEKLEIISDVAYIAEDINELFNIE